MKLQINNAGSWKHLLDFDAKDQTEVMHLVSRLAEVEAFATRASKWRPRRRLRGRRLLPGRRSRLVRTASEG